MGRKILVGLAVAGLVIFGWSQMSVAVTFSDADFSGTWSFYADWQQESAADNGWWYGPITTNGDGTIAAGPGDEIIRQDDFTDTVLDTSTYTLNADGTMTATINFGSGAVVEIEAAMNSGKDVIGFVFTDTLPSSAIVYGRGAAVKNQAGNFSNADFSGTWSFYSSLQEKDTVDNGWIYGPIASNEDGTIAAETTINGIDSSTETIAEGSTYTVNGDGTVTITLNFEDGTMDINAAMNDRKDVIPVVLTVTAPESELTLYGAGVLIKNQVGDFTNADFSGTLYMYTEWQRQDSVSNGWNYKSIISDGAGNITGGTNYEQDGTSNTIEESITYTVNSDGTVTFSGTDSEENHTTISDSKDVFASVDTSISHEGHTLYSVWVGVNPKYTAEEEEEETTTTTSGDSGGGGGCFIATAAYGTPMTEEVKSLCKFRDNILLKTTAGRDFVELYYKTSPPIADFIRNKPVLKAIVRIGLKPLVWVSKLTK